MTDKTPSDYDRDDGWSESRGVEICPECTIIFSANGGYTGPVYDQNGRQYDHHMNTDPGDGPFFCPDCWEILEANRKAAENKSIEDYA